MISPFDTSEPTISADLFDLGLDFNNEREENILQVQQQTPPNSQTTLYPAQQQQQQQRVNYLPATRAQLSGYQTPSPQRIPTMPNSGMIRPVNGIQQQTTMYTPQQMNNPSRPSFPRMPVPQQQSTLVRQPYNPSGGMVTMNTNVTQMNIVKASDPNNNNVFVPNSQAQQQSALIGLPSQHTVTQTNKPLPTGLPSLNSQQFTHFQVPQQQNNPLQTYNMRVSLRGQCRDSSSSLFL